MRRCGEWRAEQDSAVGPWLCVGGHFEEVEDPADISVQPTQGLGDGEPACVDELDGEASQAGGVFGAVAGADAAPVLSSSLIWSALGMHRRGDLDHRRRALRFPIGAVP